MTGRQVAESVKEAGGQITLICTLRTGAARRRDSRQIEVGSRARKPLMFR
jgi:hypothetical protein